MAEALVTRLLRNLGEEFAERYAKDGPKAWQWLMIEVMRNMHLLAASGMVGDVHSIVAIARDVENHVRSLSGKKGGGTAQLPLDAIGEKWRAQQSREGPG